MAGKSSFLVQGQVLFQRAMASHGDLHLWGDAFVKDVLNNGRWNKPGISYFKDLAGQILGLFFILSANVVPLLQYRKDATMDVLYPLLRAFFEKVSELARVKVFGSVLMGDVAMGAIMPRIDQIGLVGGKKTHIHVFGLMRW